MGARILNLNGAEVDEDSRPTNVSRSACNLEDLAATYLLSAVNERGQRCVAVTGLYTRIYGPFARKSDAIAGFELFRNGALVALCASLNDASAGENRGLQFIQLPDYMDGQADTQGWLWRKP
jgi:hypothetical protein